MRIADLDLERIAARGWQAEHTEWLGAWLLRANDGFTGRANSVLPLGASGTDVDTALEHVARWYAAHDLPPRVAVPSPARDDLAGALRQRGWTPSWGARVMVAQIDDLPLPDATATPPVVVRPEPSLAWQAAYHYRGGRLPEAGRRLLVRGEVLGFAHVGDDPHVIAIGRGAVTDGWLGITAVEVDPAHRRQGLATRVLAALSAWGRGRGARRVYLQVDLGNEIARAMYAAAGFVEHHTYRYFDAPA